MAGQEDSARQILGRARVRAISGAGLAKDRPELEDFGRRCGLFHDSQPYQRPQAAATPRYGPDSQTKNAATDSLALGYSEILWNSFRKR